MSESKLYVRYMISLRCTMVVKKVLKSLNIVFTHVESGTILLPNLISEEVQAQLSRKLRVEGFTLLDTETCEIINQIDEVMVDLVLYSEAVAMENSVNIISERLGKDSEYLATVFAEVKGITLSQYVQNIRIERVKELLLYDQLSLESVAIKLKYNNTVELRAHFKRATGLAPSFFIEMGKKRRALIPTV